MAWEISGLVIAAKCILLAASTVAAVGVVGYGIYRYKKYWEGKGPQPQQQHNNMKSESPVTSNFSTIDELKQPNSNLRRRNVDQENKTKEDVDNKKNENESIKKEQSHQSFILPTHENDDTASVASSITLDGTESTCDSLASTETVTSDLDLDLRASMIPTWSEMSDAERNLYLCRTCEKSVSTIAIPCEHPFLCDECAPILFKNYSYCPLCSKKVDEFRSVNSVYI